MVLSKKEVKKLMEGIHTQTAKNFGWMETSEMVRILNWKIRGLSNYFTGGAVWKSYRKIS
jgi:hypothetical protein